MRLSIFKQNTCIRAFSFLAFFCSTGSQCKPAMTNQQSWGRLGDNVMQYITCKWLAHKYNLPFYFLPFPGSEYFMASTQERLLSDLPEHLKNRIKVKHESEIANGLKLQGTFYLRPYSRCFGFPTSDDVVGYLLLNSSQDLLQDLRSLLRSKNTINLPALPSDAICVAVHIRKPSGGKDAPLYSEQTFDTTDYEFTRDIINIKINQNIKNYSLPTQQKLFQPTVSTKYADVVQGSFKFPPTQFYIDQIKELSKFLNDAPLYIKLFSDATNLQNLYDGIKKGVNKPNIIYAEIDSQKNPKTSFIEDCEEMAQFDCLIKSASSFSSISQLTGNHAISIVPCQSLWDDRKLIINKTIWFIRNNELNNLIKKCSYFESN